MQKTDFIIPIAKQSGITSFASMSAVKKALSTKKVGHTGTLDKFADGLLVLLSGKLTKLAEAISAAEKTYEAWCEFGVQTDSLDPEGSVILKKNYPLFKDLLKVLPAFKGIIQQTPPEFSAIKINGKRASDRIRSGEKLQLKQRPIEIYKLYLDYLITEENLCLLPEACHETHKIKYAKMTINCSKGTYVRSLIRDIAISAGSCAYVCALRRTATGCFKLKDAAGASLLHDFSKEFKTGIQHDFTYEAAAKQTQSFTDGQFIVKIPEKEIMQRTINFTPQIALKIGLNVFTLKKNYLKNFYSGQKISSHWFEDMKKENSHGIGKAAVFFDDECTGIIYVNKKDFKYEAVF